MEHSFYVHETSFKRGAVPKSQINIGIFGTAFNRDNEITSCTEKKLLDYSNYISLRSKGFSGRFGQYLQFGSLHLDSVHSLHFGQK